MSLDTMSARELCAGLMRGWRDELRLGYAPRSAALAAAQRKQLDENETRELLAYAQGFACGMADVIERSDPHAHYKRPSESPRHADAYYAGLTDGRREPAALLYPALEKTDA